MKSTKTINNILTKISTDATKGSGSTEKQLLNIVSAITNFIKASGDNVINEFGGNYNVEKQVREIFPASSELSGDQIVSDPLIKQAINNISNRIEKGSANTNSVVSRFTNMGTDGMSRTKKIIIGIVIIAIVAGFGFFILKKYRHKFKFIDKILSKLPGKSSADGSIELSESIAEASASTGGRRRRHRRKGRRHRDR